MHFSKCTPTPRCTHDVRPLVVPAHWGQVPCTFMEISRLVRALCAIRMKAILKSHINRGFWLRRRPKASGGVYILENTSEPPDTISLLAGGAVFFGMLALRTQRVGVLRARVCEHGVAKNKNIPKMTPKIHPNPVPPLYSPISLIFGGVVFDLSHTAEGLFGYS